MAKTYPLKGRDAALVGICAIVAANYASVKLTEYPFIYCWTEWWLGPLYASWGTLLIYLAAIWAIFALFRKTPPAFLMACGLVVAVIELPRLMDYLFRQGGSCG